MWPTFKLFLFFKTTQKQNKHDNVFGCDPNSNVNVNNKTNVIGLVCDPTSNFKFQNVKNTHCQPTCVFLKKQLNACNMSSFKVSQYQKSNFTHNHWNTFANFTNTKIQTFSMTPVHCFMFYKNNNIIITIKHKL